ncbi:hypothetical protein BZG36_04634 [Bifiguratus adelaidae]|uniref:Threonyl/alanyl tRNA synthetase SAD domain-containing protein n=1 Tax=Bifiguratus adelaidae TaxID=1938954 RepID=A0A261XUX8_9FUNG|nr:hypothetical protein BZG36_04634 [Bifiguratus adelaidae]
MVPALDASPDQVLVGGLACQRDGYARSLETTCLACTPLDHHYEVWLKDTVLFPEGGGQPSDQGTLNGSIKVLAVERRGVHHVHLCDGPVEVNSTVTMTVDWERRWDHMQQHTGQHLLSAILEQPPYNWETVSWNMGQNKSYVELTPKDKAWPDKQTLAEVEKVCNDHIISGLAISVTTSQDRPNTLPEDYHGNIIRTVTIDGVDANPCCGTHMRTTSDLQCIKLLHTEKVRGKNLRLFFVVGRRAQDLLTSLYDVSRELTGILSGPPETFVDSVTRIQKEQRASFKLASTLYKEIAGYVSKDLEDRLKTERVIVYAREADMPFINTISMQLSNKLQPDQVVVLASLDKATGNDNNGAMIMLGPSDRTAAIAKALESVFTSIKGGGKQRWQGKWSGAWKEKDVLAAITEP